MLNRGSKSSLKLNSYKIDTDALQSSLRELNDMKEELETTISYYKNHEEELAKENERLKEEIGMLQKTVSVKADHSKCLEKYVRLEKELKDEKKEFSKYQEMYEKEKKITSQLSMEISKIKETYSKEERKHVELIENYKQRTMSLESQLKEFYDSLKEQKYKDSKQIEKKREISKKEIKKESYHESSSVVSDYEDQNNSQYSKEYHNKNLSHPHSKNNIHQYNVPSKNEIREISSKNPSEGINFSYTASYLPNEEDEEIFHSASIICVIAVRKIYHEVKDLGISGRKILVLPQFKKMSQTKNPSRKDLSNFFRSPPIEEKNEYNIEKSLNYLENLVYNKYGILSGEFITEILIKKIEEYENLENLNTDDLEISGMTPSLSHSGKGSSLMRKEVSSKRSIGNEGNMSNFYGRPSMLDYLKIESSKFMSD